MIKVYGRDPNIKSFDAARTFLAGRLKRKLVNNTFLEVRDGGAIALRYHNTDVVTYKPDGNIILNTGGWKTVTTKERLNAFSPVSVSVRRGVWYVSRIVDGIETDLGTYFDYMMVDASGSKVLTVGEVTAAL